MKFDKFNNKDFGYKLAYGLTSGYPLSTLTKKYK